MRRLVVRPQRPCEPANSVGAVGAVSTESPVQVVFACLRVLPGPRQSIAFSHTFQSPHALLSRARHDQHPLSTTQRLARAAEVPSSCGHDIIPAGAPSPVCRITYDTLVEHPEEAFSRMLAVRMLWGWVGGCVCGGSVRAFVGKGKGTGKGKGKGVDAGAM